MAARSFVASPPLRSVSAPSPLDFALEHPDVSPPLRPVSDYHTPRNVRSAEVPTAHAARAL